MLTSRLITPYRGECYYLKEYLRNPTWNFRELLNLWYASLRNEIETVFGVLKKRFPGLAISSQPTYGLKTQKLMILACCILHNFLMGVDLDKSIIAEVDEKL